MEATFKVLNTEFVRNRNFKGLDQLKLELADYVNWFNHHGFHSTLNYETLVQYRLNTILSFVNASNASGAYNDAAVICKKVRAIKPDIYILIDGVQYAPVAPIDVAAWQPDAYVFGPYKLTCCRGYGLVFFVKHFSLKKS